MKNKELALIFEKIADALEFQGENPFKIIAYRKAARILNDLTEDIAVIHQKAALREIPGIGEGIAKKIDEYLTTGRMKKYDEVTAHIPDRVLELMAIPNLGPKTVSLVYKELGVQNLADLRKVIEDGSLAQLPGMGEKKAQNILKGIERYEASRERIPLGDAFPLGMEVVNALKQLKDVEQVSPAGSLRRLKETIGDIDILVAM